MTKIGSSLFIILVLILGALWAGNKVLVEKHIERLDNLNIKAVKSKKNLPQYGKVHTKAYVVGKENNETIKIIEQKIGYQPTTYKEGKTDVPH